MVLVEEGAGRLASVGDDYSELTDALARIRGAGGASTIWAGVKEFASRFGFCHVLALDLTRLAGGATGAVLYSDALPLLGEVDREMAVDKHPVVRRVLESAQPFLVSELRDDPQHRGARWVELLADPVRQGDGLVVPVHRNGGPFAGANFGGHAPNTSVLTRALMQVVTHAAVDRAISLRDGPKASANALSARESQCLRHVAIGRPDAEIGMLLGISPRTVRFHVDSAKAKLGVATRIQAVAKALRERIIAV
jgi:DNA-binding CsgD family transcriptional regulator